MKSRLYQYTIPGFLLMLCCFLPARAQELVEKPSFEGVVGFEVRDFQSIEPMTLFMKRGRLRLEGTEQAGGNAILLDYGKKKSFIINSGRELYVELPAVLVPPKGELNHAKVNIQKTDSTIDILDYSCDEFLVTVDSLEYEIWATKGLGTAGTFLTVQVHEWEAKILDMGYFPMRLVMRDAWGEESARFEVTSMTKKTMSESLFRIPSGFEKVDQEALQPKAVAKKKKR